MAYFHATGAVSDPGRRAGHHLGRHHSRGPRHPRLHPGRPPHLLRLPDGRAARDRPGAGRHRRPLHGRRLPGPSPAETPRATSALNAIQRTAGAVVTALFAIILQHTITANLPRHPQGIQAFTALPPGQQAHAAPALAAAFGTTFWAAAALIATSLLPALFLPRPAREPPAATGQAAK